MMKDILGEILNAKKGQAMTVTINIEPNEQSEEDKVKAEGLAPALEDKDAKVENESPELMDGDEKDAMKRKMKGGLKPQGLSDRAKMYSLEE